MSEFVYHIQSRYRYQDDDGPILWSKWQAYRGNRAVPYYFSKRSVRAALAQMRRPKRYRTTWEMQVRVLVAPIGEWEEWEEDRG